MARRLAGALREAPTTVPALVALALFVVWATSQAGYPVTHWAPGGLIVLGLLAAALWAVRPQLAEIPVAVRVALACLLAYTLLSYLSIAWAGVTGDAWEGANRTLLYLLVFALFACWPQRGATAAALLVLWTLAIVAIALHAVLHVDAAAAHAARIDPLMPGGRLIYPSGYANANAAEWMMAFWPALLLARSRLLHWALRGLLAGGAALLALVALMSLSRGSLYATPVMIVLVFALLPGRVRTVVVLTPVALAIAAVAPSIVHASERLEHDLAAGSALHSAIASSLWAAAAVAVAVAVGAAIEQRAPISDGQRRRAHRAIGAAALAGLLVLAVGGLIAAGNPLTRAEHAWNTFKSERGYAANGSGNRLLSGLGSTRYDLYRVELNEFLAHPVVGIGADNIQQQYLRHGRSLETPRYPHSLELRTLVQTGLIGALIALVGFGAALLASFRAVRPRGRADPLAATVAAAALAGFGYWVVHGSLDWFWEFAGLGAPAFALLGICCSLTPRAEPAGEPASESPPAAAASASEQPAEARRARDPRRIGLAAGALVVVLAALLTLGAPWLSQLQVQNAARIWARSPARAYADLRQAADLNPLSDEPYLVAGSIALRYDELTEAEAQFEKALARSSGDDYATLQLGAIASARGQRARALRLLTRATELNPRGALPREALAVVRRGERVNIQALDRALLSEGQALV